MVGLSVMVARSAIMHRQTPSKMHSKVTQPLLLDTSGLVMALVIFDAGFQYGDDTQDHNGLNKYQDRTG